MQNVNGPQAAFFSISSLENLFLNFSLFSYKNVFLLFFKSEPQGASVQEINKKENKSDEISAKISWKRIELKTVLFVSYF